MRSRTIPCPTGRLVITPRDVKVASLTYLHRAVTEDHLMALCGYSAGPTIRARLRRLFDGQILRRSYVAKGAYSNKTVYSLGPAGTDLVAEALGLNAGEVRRFIDLTPARISLEHSLLLSDIRVSVESTLRTAGAKQVRYLPEVSARDEYTVIESGREMHRIFKPDGYVEFVLDSKHHAAFLEGDRSTASSDKVRELLRHYRYYQENVYRDVYSHDRFAVLFVTTGGDRRLANLVSLSQRNSEPPVYFTTATLFFEHGLLAPIWSVNGCDDLVPFGHMEVRQ